MSAPHPSAQSASPASASPALGDEPGRAILLVLAATAMFSVSDTLAKQLSGSLPAIEITWLRWIGFVLIMSPSIVLSGGRTLRTRAPGLQFLRTLGVLGSAVFFIAGLHYLPIASASAIAFVAPLLVTALSIPFLGEQVGPRRWAAVVVGLIGMLVVIRPGSGTFGLAALLPFLSAVSWAFALIVTRKLGGIDRTSTTMTYSALVGLAALTLAVPFDWVTPSLHHLGLAAAMAIASTAAQFFVVMAYRLGRASVLAPVSYVQLVWAGLLGFLVFGNIPDGWTLIGAGIIMASGIYTAHRERVVARAKRRSAG